MQVSFIVFLGMLVMHYLSDWVLQTDVVAKYKQKDNWKEYGDKYKHDYMSVLNIHSIFWSICIMSPIIILDICTCGFNNDHGTLIVILIIINTLIHYMVDDFKANSKCINLSVDQLIHIAQILISVFVYFIFI